MQSLVENPILKRNNIKILGNGTTPMLFAHGFGCDQNMWRYVYTAFEDDYKIILFDHVGAGQSDANAFSEEKYSSLEGYALDVVEIIQELDLENVIFVGHSVSAMIGVLAAGLEPERFQQLILIGPSPRYINDFEYTGGFSEEDILELLETMDGNYLGWSSQTAPMIMGNADKPELGEELTNSFCRTNPEIAKNFARVTFLSDNRADLKKVKTPSLILQCSDDIIAPLEVGKYVHQNLQNSTFNLMEATGHCPNLSAPDETILFIKNYLNINKIKF
ncbi:MAG TPA: alpha/beta hydrolase [Anditalea sp.]|nr:alpha/beta hydrolase [Anditalea sp.]